MAIAEIPITTELTYPPEYPTVPNSLDTLRQVFFQIAGEKLGSLRETDFALLKRTYPSRGNTINYVVDLLETYTKYYGDYEKRESEISNNLQTAIIEHALADSTGIYTYTNFWKPDDEGSSLYTEYGSLSEIIQNSIDDETGQVPEFEIHRNIQELLFLNKLTTARNRGVEDTGVVFSPSPDMSDPEAKVRGYQGNDQIRISRKGKNGLEEQTIYWFPRVGTTQYIDLVQQLIEADPNHSSSQYLRDSVVQIIDNPTDVNIMACSNIFSDKQMGIITNFIEQNQQQLPTNHSVITDYINTVIQEDTIATLISVAYQGAISLLKGDTLSLNQKLKQIFDLIEEAQFSFRLFIRDHGNINTFTPEISNQVNYTWSQYQQMSFEDRQQTFRPSGFSGSGCGFSGQSTKLGNGSVIWGPMSSVNIHGVESSFPVDFGDPHIGSCKGCMQLTTLGGCNLCVECHNKY